MRNIKLTLFMVALVAGWLGGFTNAHAAIINSVSRGGTSENTPPVIAPNSLNEDELCYVDRTHKYSSVPTTLLGAEYVMVSNSDKTQADYSLDVTLSHDARVLLFLDNRLGYGSIPGGDPNLNPDLWAAGMGWVYDMGFMDTGMNIGIDEGGDGQIDQWASVYFKSVSYGTITLLAQNDVTKPADRNMYGVAALKKGAFQSFWYYGGPSNLVHTPQPVSVPKGYFGGWFWWQDDEGNLYLPGENEDTGYRFDIATDYNYEFPIQPDDEPRDFYGHYSKWAGNPYFWAFTDRMTFTYNDTRIRTVDRWMYFWDPANIGNCLIMFSEDMGSGGPGIYPLHYDTVNNLEVLSHTFTVNTRVSGQFSGMETILTSQLEDYVRSCGMTDTDVHHFMSSKIIRRLLANDPNGLGPVLVSHGIWNHLKPTIESEMESLELQGAEEAGIKITIAEQPSDFPQRVTVTSSDPESLWLVGADTNGILQLIFDQHNWHEPQTVIVQSIFNQDWEYELLEPDSPIGFDSPDGDSEHPPPYFDTIFPPYSRLVNKVKVAAYITDDPCDGFVLPVTIVKGDCGGRGFTFGDLNHDCITDFRDFAIFTSRWLASTELPVEIDLTNQDQFSNKDVGTTGGSAFFDDGDEVWTIQGDGHDIWDITDGFHYVYKPLAKSVHTQLMATVRTLEDTHIWAKAGIMFRDELTPDSAHAMIVVTPHRGVVFQWRQWTGHITETIQYGPVAHLKAPISLCLEVKDNIVTGYYYQSGRWIKLGNAAVSFDPQVPTDYMGMLASSHVQGVLTTATFDKKLVGD